MQLSLFRLESFLTGFAAHYVACCDLNAVARLASARLYSGVSILDLAHQVPQALYLSRVADLEVHGLELSDAKRDCGCLIPVDSGPARAVVRTAFDGEELDLFSFPCFPHDAASRLHYAIRSDPDLEGEALDILCRRFLGVPWLKAYYDRFDLAAVQSAREEIGRRWQNERNADFEQHFLAMRDPAFVREYVNRRWSKERREIEAQADVALGDREVNLISSRVRKAHAHANERHSRESLQTHVPTGNYPMPAVGDTLSVHLVEEPRPGRRLEGTVDELVALVWNDGLPVDLPAPVSSELARHRYDWRKKYGTDRVVDEEEELRRVRIW